MRLTKGSKVEVFSTKEVPSGSWLCASIISGNSHTYSVRYGCVPLASEAVEERVPRKALRPCPPPAEGADNWVSGDHLEVFQNFAWKTATVMKVLGGDFFSVRLLGKSEEFRAHKFCLRVRQSWQDGKWVVVGKGDKHDRMSVKKNQAVKSTKLYVSEDCFPAAKNIGFQEPYILTARRKRAPPVDVIHLGVREVCAVKKVRPTGKDGTVKRIFAESSSSLKRKVEAYLWPRDESDRKFSEIDRSTVQTSLHVATTRFSEIDTDRGKPNDSRASSVGSCSSNGNIHYRWPFCSVKVENVESKSFRSDAESFCGHRYEEEVCSLSEREEQGARVHRSELNAYHCAIKELYASGLLSWEDEMKLTDMRIALHISVDEHLAEVRNLIAASGKTS